MLKLNHTRSCKFGFPKEKWNLLLSSHHILCLETFWTHNASRRAAFIVSLYRQFIPNEGAQNALREDRELFSWPRLGQEKYKPVTPRFSTELEKVNKMTISSLTSPNTIQRRFWSSMQRHGPWWCLLSRDKPTKSTEDSRMSRLRQGSAVERWAPPYVIALWLVPEHIFIVVSSHAQCSLRFHI